MSNEVIIKVLGTAQDAGIPHANCHCEHCLRALQQPEESRYAASLAIIFPQKQIWHLVDATPDMCEQIEMIRANYPNMGLMNSILLTHAHIGHYTGLMFLGREVISSRDLPVYAGLGMETLLRNHVPWKQLVDLSNINIKPITAERSFELEQSVVVTPIEVPHRNEYSETFCFIISGSDKKLLYIPDIDRWEQWDINLKDIALTVDYCLLDATFYSEDELTSRGRSYQEIPHPLLTHTMSLLQEVVDQKSTKVYFTHFNHTNPVVNPNNPVREFIQEKGFYIAEDGMEFVL